MTSPTRPALTIGDRVLIGSVQLPWAGLRTLVIWLAMAGALFGFTRDLNVLPALFLNMFVIIPAFVTRRIGMWRLQAALERYEEAFLASDRATVEHLRPVVGGRRSAVVNGLWPVLDADAAALDGKFEEAVGILSKDAKPTPEQQLRITQYFLAAKQPARAVASARETLRLCNEMEARTSKVRRQRARMRRAAIGNLGAALSLNGEHATAVKTLQDLLDKTDVPAACRHARHFLAASLLALHRTDEAVALLNENVAEGGPWAPRAADLLSRASESPHRGFLPAAPSS